MRTKRRLLALTALVFLSVGGVGLAGPPGLFGFAATECGGGGDCANQMAPVILSLLSALVGGLLALSVVRSVGAERWRETRA
ncbi:hypothetical protein [Halopelagius longus]|uniref:Uncharacterized protein n=1 Tax=Halopelagius longus TaxID=1236180 RepID=A0A1H1EQV1_9EURY|nr:hypothetical protein [Halopelagius longus]RDI71848.1 hypothetical protein DWB78_08995 [Halopelagius longus]SDQ90948.1 hypothetical protein SAMN05216278_3016 [Halopelagius longus]